MRSTRLAAASALLVLLAAPPVHAAGFAADLPFTDVTTSQSLPLLSGSLDVRAPAGDAPTLMHNVTAFEINGLAAVCWEYPCYESSGPLAVRVFDGSTVALRYPQTGDLHLTATRAVAAPVALDGDKAGFGDLSAGMQLAPSLVAATQHSSLVFTTQLLPVATDGPVPAPAPAGAPPEAAAFFQAPDPTAANGAVLAALTEGSRMQVIDGGRVVHDLPGYGGLLLQGAIQVDPVIAEAFVLPCAVQCDARITAQGASVDLEQATSSILALIELAQGTPLPAIDLGPFADVLDPLADGVYVDLPLLQDPSQFSVRDITVARFDSLQATIRPGADPAPGSGPLVIVAGDVQGGPEFVGGKYFAMPLWSYIVWAVAILLVVLAAATGASKEHDLWDRFRFVGWVLGALAWVALAWIWNANFGHVVGVSATTGGLSFVSWLVLLAFELGTLLAMVLVVVLPIRLVLSRSLRLLRQGRFMGLAGPVATVLGILLGTPLLLGFVDLALHIVQ